MEHKRKICVYTSTRADYGLLKPVLRRIQDSDVLELQLIVSGTHLLERFGKTKDQIIEDGFQIEKEIKLEIPEEKTSKMVNSIGKGILRINESIQDLKPNISLVLGDRYEILSFAIASSYNKIPLGHIHGGDKTQGGFDEYTRHAVTKIAHLHFPATKESAERIKKMGEDPDKIFNVGSTSVDTIKNTDIESEGEIREKFDIPKGKDLFLFVQHPVSTSPESSVEEFEETLKALNKFSGKKIGIYPNMDPGGTQIIEKIEEEDSIDWYENITFEEYLGILSIADVMIGNSSSGIIEAPYFNLPAVNIGPRQKNRTQSNNVIDVDYEANEIEQGIEKALKNQDFNERIQNSKHPYGDGSASKKIVQNLKEIEINDELLNKQIEY